MQSHVHIPQKTFDLRPVSELLSIVKNDLRKLDDEGLVDEGVVIKTVMACNDRLGILLRDIEQLCIKVHDFKAKLPLDFEKLYFISAITATNTIIHHQGNPFNNNFDQDIIYKAELDRGSLGCAENYRVIINRTQNTTVHYRQNFIDLNIEPGSFSLCHNSCPNMKSRSNYSVTIENGYIHTPFRSGEIYIMYLASMKDKEGNILYPFHPLITPYYEWSIKEKVIMDAIFNSDGDYAQLLKLTQAERVKAWLDAYNITTEKGFGEWSDLQKKKELSWYNQFFKYFQ